MPGCFVNTFFVFEIYPQDSVDAIRKIVDSLRSLLTHHDFPDPIRSIVCSHVPELRPKISTPPPVEDVIVGVVVCIGYHVACFCKQCSSCWAVLFTIPTHCSILRVVKPYSPAQDRLAVVDSDGDGEVNDDSGAAMGAAMTPEQRAEKKRLDNKKKKLRQQAAQAKREAALAAMRNVCVCVV